MRTVGQSEFRTHLYAIARDVRDNRASYTITKRGNPVAMIVPYPNVPELSPEDREEAWDNFLNLAQEIGAASTSTESTADIMRWQRGRLD